MKTILITGANGVLAKTLSVYIHKKYPWKIINTTRQPKSAKYIKLDVNDEKAVKKIIKKQKPDIIFHCAANYSSDLKTAFTTNVLGASHLLNAISQSKKKTRLVLIGSAAEYGNVLPGENPVQESQTLRPITTYGLTKAWQTQLGLQWSNNGHDIVVARIFNLMGSGFSKRLFIGHLQNEILQVKNGNKKHIQVGPLEAIRDYIDVKEAAEQVMAIAQQGVAGKVYNVGSGRPIRMKFLLKKILDQNKLKFSIVRKKKNKKKSTWQDVPIIFASTSRIKKLLKRNLNDNQK